MAGSHTRGRCSGPQATAASELGMLFTTKTLQCPPRTAAANISACPSPLVSSGLEGLRGSPAGTPCPARGCLQCRAVCGFWVLNLRQEGPIPGASGTCPVAIGRVGPSIDLRRRGKEHLTESRICCWEDPKKAGREEAAFSAQHPTSAFCWP